MSLSKIDFECFAKFTGAIMGQSKILTLSALLNITMEV